MNGSGRLKEQQINTSLPDEITIFRGLFALDNLCTEALMPLFLETAGEIKYLGSRLLYMPKIS
jgi:hypothetical protein